MQVTSHAEVTIAGEREEIFAALVSDAGLVAHCRKLGPFAAIVEATTHGEPVAGTRRSVRMSDGMRLEETIAEHDPPRVHAYGWADPPMPLGALIRKADAVWRFEHVDERTRVTWTYTFTLRGPLAWPLGKLVSLGFRRWMQAALENGKAAIEG